MTAPVAPRPHPFFFVSLAALPSVLGHRQLPCQPPDVSVCILYESIEHFGDTEEGISGVERAVFSRMRPSHVVVIASVGGWTAEKLGQWSSGVCERYDVYEGEEVHLDKAMERCVEEGIMPPRPKTEEETEAWDDGMDKRGHSDGEEKSEDWKGQEQVSPPERTGGQREQGRVDLMAPRAAVIFHLKSRGASEGGGGERELEEGMNGETGSWGGRGGLWSKGGERQEAIVVGEVEVKDVLSKHASWGSPT